MLYKALLRNGAGLVEAQFLHMSENLRQRATQVVLFIFKGGRNIKVAIAPVPRTTQ